MSALDPGGRIRDAVCAANRGCDIYHRCVISLIVLWATRTKPLIKDQITDAQVSPRSMQIVALIEAAMLGYALARKSGHRPH